MTNVNICRVQISTYSNISENYFIKLFISLIVFDSINRFLRNALTLRNDITVIDFSVDY